ncbi:MAG: electron transport complex subunit RsxG [Paraglaciecola sp.]|nr:electron transport complex subunit RsxG [Paraglaciecola sp.]NCT47709.1 electron transport complex subunit RsxG [Paraglaciecola sp.]
MKRSIASNGLILSAFALVTSGLIALTYFGTAEQINQQQQAKLQGILNAIMPSQLYDNNLVHDCVVVSDQPALGSHDAQRIYRATLNSQPVGVAIETTAPDGYSGKIKLVVGLTTDNSNNVNIQGVRILEHNETPGLGDKIDLRVSPWILSFADKTIESDKLKYFAVKKDGGQFDQFTGATITPRAVVNAVKRSALFYQQYQQQIFAASNTCLQNKPTVLTLKTAEE